MESDQMFIMFAGEVQSPKRKIEKDVKVKGYVRKGKFVRAFNRNQKVNDKAEQAKKVAVGSLMVLGGALGLGLAGAAAVKLRYNRNLIKFGKDIGKDNFPLNMKLPPEAKKYMVPKATDKESITFFMGGLEPKSAVTGEKLMREMNIVQRKKGLGLEKVHEFVPLYNNSQVVGVTSLKLPNDMGIEAQKILDAFQKAAVDGYNMDSALMAKEIYKWHKLNPTKPINMITHSAGGFQGRDIPHILEAAGVDKKLMKVFSMGSPDYGMVDDIVPTMRLMHSDDMFGQAIPVKDGRISIPSLERNSIVIGPGASKEYREIMKQNSLNYAAKNGGEPNFVPEKMMKIHAHFTPAYINGETPSSKRVYEMLEKFLATK